MNNIHSTNDWHSNLLDVAGALAYRHVCSLVSSKEINEGSNVFQSKCYEYQQIYLQDIIRMPLLKQQVLVAWNKFNDQEELNRFYDRSL